MPFRITTVSRLSGKPTTKSFRNSQEGLARETWAHLTGSATQRRAFIYAGFYAQQTSDSLPHVIDEYLSPQTATMVRG